ncbi:small hydrophilic protein [Streptomyces sp. NPDC003035]|uniref:small hydrophilic protein n=1 Tax=Streptomyces sp. NPDC003035 TaxID=3364676 RepID=UPI0036AD10E4
MSFTHRMATLAAVVAIPLGIAATSYGLTDEPEAPRVPPAVELSSPPVRTSPSGSSPSGSPPSGSSPDGDTPGGDTPGGSAPSGSAPSPGAAPPAPPSDAVVPGPSATGDDDDDLREES